VETIGPISRAKITIPFHPYFVLIIGLDGRNASLFRCCFEYKEFNFLLFELDPTENRSHKMVG